jgi:diadenosine tetraphosphate (Ap4A) HIT family hydrolase
VPCLPCDTVGPGGIIVETDHWLVDHTIGSLGVGTLIVKPKRHVVHVADLTPAEAAELDPLLREVSAAVTHVAKPDQVYVSLWSHAGGRPGHIHFVVQPVTRAAMEELGALGPHLQVALFDRREPPEDGAAAAFAERVREQSVARS